MKKDQSNNVSLKTAVVIISIVLFSVSIFSVDIFTKVSKAPKIAVVDNNYLVSQFSEAIAAKKTFEQQKLVWDKNIKAIQDTLDTIVKEMSSTYARASAQKKAELESRLNHWNQEYRQYLKTIDQLSVKKEQELMNPVLEQLNSFVKTWAKQNGYDIVIGSANGGVILSVEDYYNVTFRILSDLNKMYQIKNTPSTTDQTGSSQIQKGSEKDTAKK